MMSKINLTGAGKCFYFFLNDTPTTEIYTLSLHDALPISFDARLVVLDELNREVDRLLRHVHRLHRRKSTRLNSSHSQISYAVFCLKKKKTKTLANKTKQPDSYLIIITDTRE